jgi:hypothetical protein
MKPIPASKSQEFALYDPDIPAEGDIPSAFTGVWLPPFHGVGEPVRKHQ